MVFIAGQLVGSRSEVVGLYDDILFLPEIFFCLIDAAGPLIQK